MKSPDFIKALRDFRTQAYQLGASSGEHPEKRLEKLLAQARARGITDTTSLTNQFNLGKKARERSLDEKRDSEEPFVKGVSTLDIARNAEGEARSFGNNIHPNFIPNLTPAKSWTILIDETGAYFNDDLFYNPNLTHKDKKGKCAAVVIPLNSSLPGLVPGWHAVNQSYGNIKKTVQDLLNHPCGILGIPAESLNPRHGENWFSCIETLLDLILRMLPVDGETTLNIWVEQRGEATQKTEVLLEKTCQDCLHHFTETFPETASKIHMNPHIISKSGHRYNGYADVVAFLWGSGLKKLLRRTGWKNTCLLGTDPKLLRKALTWFNKKAPMTPEMWLELVRDTDFEVQNSLGSILLTKLGEETQQDAKAWQGFLELVQEHLYSKAIDLQLLHRQIAWLKRFTPDVSALTPYFQLLWQTTRLADANHVGDVEESEHFFTDFSKNCDLLRDEKIELVALAVLHMSTYFTNKFEFDLAEKALEPILDKTMHFPGAQYDAQALSSRGQARAFLGRNEEASADFSDAISSFEKLSDERVGRLDIHQTQAYRVISKMDTPGMPDSEVLADLESYLGSSLSDAVERLAVSCDTETKYDHHILLRYLAGSNREPEREAYLSHRADWKTAVGHPWELITFYRAILVGERDAELRDALLHEAYEKSLSGGITLKLIACVILGGQYYFDPTCREALERLTQEVLSSLPALGPDRTARLTAQLQTPQPPLFHAQSVLPFNFR